MVQRGSFALTPGPEANISENVTSDERPSLAEQLVVVTVALGTMLPPLNSTMIAVALPGVMDDFDIGLASAGWLVTAYLIVMASPLYNQWRARLGIEQAAVVWFWAGYPSSDWRHWVLPLRLIYGSCLGSGYCRPWPGRSLFLMVLP
jgi:hypothetical protein